MILYSPQIVFEYQQIFLIDVFNVDQDFIFPILIRSAIPIIIVEKIQDFVSNKIKMDNASLV